MLENIIIRFVGLFLPICWVDGEQHDQNQGTNKGKIGLSLPHKVSKIQQPYEEERE